MIKPLILSAFLALPHLAWADWTLFDADVPKGSVLMLEIDDSTETGDIIELAEPDSQIVYRGIVNLDDTVKALQLALKYLLPPETIVTETVTSHDLLYRPYIPPTPLEQLEEWVKEEQRQADAAKQRVEDIKYIQDVLSKLK